eukprot:TRINITY_DN2740_c0_g1_i2.p1 TRINITY_DN2740_c0_g1~~TRINITY_DN2740_c0_g1_i2.p1  ORF type:complete len:334 (-),score=68.36 TRINITY_DN2740_c0_g1_i2:23-1024(-)
MCSCKSLRVALSNETEAAGVDSVVIRVDQGTVLLYTVEGQSAIVVESIVQASDNKTFRGRLGHYSFAVKNRQLSVFTCSASMDRSCEIGTTVTCENIVSGGAVVQPALALLLLCSAVALACRKPARFGACSLVVSALLVYRQAAAAAVSTCGQTLVSLKLPASWHGTVTVETADAAIAINSPLTLSSLSLRSETGVITSTWDSPVEVTSLALHVGSGKTFLARTTTTTCAASTATGYVTFGDVTVQDSPSLDFDACNGRLEVAQLKDFNGAFTTNYARSGSIDITGHAETTKWDHSDPLRVKTVGTVNGGTGSGTMSVQAVQGHVVIFAVASN